MSKHNLPKSLLAAAALLVSLGTLVGCAETPKELIAADQAIAAAKASGKDKECPEMFASAERMRKEAWALCKPCDNEKAIAMANEATRRANSLCPAVPPRKPAPAMKAAAVPAAYAALSANPSSIKQGECSTLTWSSTNASSTSIDQRIGRVDPNGSRQVCPTQTTQYRIGVMGEGGAGDASATVTVMPSVVDRMSLHLHFATNKATTTSKVDEADLEKATAFIKKYPAFKVSVEGHTDSTGKPKHNQRLSEARASFVKDRIVSRGIDASKIRTSGFGETRPVADNSTPEGRAQNRRVDVLIVSE
jgi:outer membrane protein OmpA-like peptidoglycan-associated protein